MKTKNFLAMNTYMSITVYDEVSNELLDNLQNKVDKLEALWSVTRKNSEIYAINHIQERGIVVSEETAEIIQFSLEMDRQTDGALDITLYPVLKEWGFTTKSHRIPSEKKVAEKMQCTGIEKICVKKNKVFTQPNVQIDLGAVAKGYACDLVLEDMRKRGITSAIINLGGNIGTLGVKPDGNKFKIAVQHPKNGEVLGILYLTDMCVAVSDISERYFVGEDGKKYGHILNPITGKPMDSDLLSVTVINEEGKICDALSTALFVKGLKGTVKYYKEHEKTEFLVMTENEEIYLTSGVEKCFAVSEKYKEIPIHIISKQE